MLPCVWVSLVLHRILWISIPTATSSAQDFLGKGLAASPRCLAMLWGHSPCSEDGGGRGPGSPRPCFAFGEASCDGAAIPAVNKPFPGLLMGTIWQREAPRPLHSCSFPAGNGPGLHRERAENGPGLHWACTGNRPGLHWIYTGIQPCWPLWRRERGNAPCTLLPAGNLILQRQAGAGDCPGATPDVPSPSICPGLRQEGERGCRRLLGKAL